MGLQKTGVNIWVAFPRWYLQMRDERNIFAHVLQFGLPVWVYFFCCLKLVCFLIAVQVFLFFQYANLPLSATKSYTLGLKGKGNAEKVSLIQTLKVRILQPTVPIEQDWICSVEIKFQWQKLNSNVFFLELWLIWENIEEKLYVFSSCIITRSIQPCMKHFVPVVSDDVLRSRNLLVCSNSKVTPQGKRKIFSFWFCGKLLLSIFHLKCIHIQKHFIDSDYKPGLQIVCMLILKTFF